MYEQKLKSPAPGPLKGLLIVAGLAAAILLDWSLTRLLPEPAATAVFWALGLLLALWTLRRFVLSYNYVLTQDALRISYAYGRRQRAMAELYYNNVIAVGTPEAVRPRWPNARVSRAVLKRNPLPVVAVVCRDNGSPAVFLLQPDGKILRKLEQICDAACKK